MNYKDAIYAIMFSNNIDNLKSAEYNIKGYWTKGDFLDNLLLNLEFIANEIDYLDKDLLKLIAYEKVLGKDAISNICKENEIELNEEFFKKCEDENLNEVKLIEYIWKALENSKKINYETAKFSEPDLMVRLEDEIIQNSTNGKINIGEIYEILTKESKN